ncbi:cob(I)yrinic acid a,c-diamide adenosyltransferase [Psychrobacter aestuarii]|uniref:Corrinoid adenosyltransferase n=1 Tax=Psychrobacter aestuarii TaxID=556327 RepID=A0ABN0VXT1_9GAMM|nr:cob(I)yrinic acid a,c-diamide adenosyltransferase [Psychrobacter aestuarii]
MGNRLSKIYTRTGDDGSTGMADGQRISKADAIFATMGDVDELNSQLGMVRAQLSAAPTHHGDKADAELMQTLTIIQHLLFNLGGELAMPEYQGVNDQHILWLEAQIDHLNNTLPPLKDFILPTGSALVSQLHIARSVCRRAERQAVALRIERSDAIRQSALGFINRLSDWLFVAARFCTDTQHSAETLWNAAVLQGFDNAE